MDREQELMNIIEYSNDTEKKAAAAKELAKLRAKTNMASLYGKAVTDIETVDVRDILQAF